MVSDLENTIEFDDIVGDSGSDYQSPDESGEEEVGGGVRVDLEKAK